jgi:hypothetical protein
MRAGPAQVTALLLAVVVVTHCATEEDVVARRVQASITGGSPGAGSGGDGTSGGAPTTGGTSPAAGSAGEGTGGAPATGGAPTTGGNAGASCTDPPFVSTALSSSQTRDACVGWAARRSFSHALCSCGDVDVPGVLSTTTFDSSTDLEYEPEGSAAVGINGNYGRTEYLRVDGSLTIAGNLPLSSSGGFDVAGDLRMAGPGTAAGPILVDRDAWLLGETSSLSYIQIGRNLQLGPEATLGSLGPVVVDGERVEEPFTIAPPCDCEQARLLDVPGIVEDGLLRNDNARIGLSLDALDTASTPVTLTLSCGRFAVQRIGGSAPISLRIEGDVVLFVAENVALEPSFTLELGPSASLDWFVRGTVSFSPLARIGDARRAGALRLYTTEPSELTLPGTTAAGLNLYAPRASVSVGGLGDVYGALFAASVSAPAALIVHYDRSIMEAGSSCGLPAASACSRCDDCDAGSACLLGTCGACVTDADCCFPLVCGAAGKCNPLGAE